MTYKTFDEWKANGYHVVKGEHSHQRNADGKAVFSGKQVEKNKPRSYHYPNKTYGYDWDYDYDDMFLWYDPNM